MLFFYIVGSVLYTVLRLHYASVSNITYAALQDRAFLNDLECCLTWATWACRTSRELWMIGESQVGIMGHFHHWLSQASIHSLTHTSHVTSLLECSVCLPLTLMFIDKYTSRNWWQSQDQIFQWHTFSNTFTPCHLKTLFPDNCMLNPAKGAKKVPKIQ